MGSPEWKYGSFGTKIEKAVSYRDGGLPLRIVHEDTWANPQRYRRTGMKKVRLALLGTEMTRGSRRYRSNVPNRAGPPLVSGAPTREMHRCTMAQVQLFPGSKGHCYESFAAADGTRVGRGELYTEIAYTFDLAPQLGPPFNEPGVPRAQTEYRLHLVALSPTVIVGVPLDRYEGRCTEHPGGRGCIHVKARRATAGREDWRAREWSVHYNVPLPARLGSFVYAPGLKRAAQPLPDLPTATVDLGNGRSLQMRQVGGMWELVPSR